MKSTVILPTTATFLCCALLLFTPSVSAAAPITVPSGLNAGDHYRLAFVTGTGHDAQSTVIADYNAFVTSVANSVPALAALGTAWTVIGSTTSVDARDNTLTNPTVSTGVPIYNLGDSRVADDNADLWDGAIQAPIQFDETGTALPTIFVHTGTDTAGVVVGQGIGDTAAGSSTATGSLWVIGRGGENQYFVTSFYAMSGVLTVVPEPASMTLWGAAAAALLGVALRRRRAARK